MDDSIIYLNGLGLGSLSAAVYLVQKAGFKPENIHILEKNPETYKKISSILEKNNMENFLRVYKLFVFHKDDEIFQNIKVNTLVMTGENDLGSTVYMSTKLSDVINNSQLKVIKNGKHLCGIECADDVNMTIKNFIEQND